MLMLAHREGRAGQLPRRILSWLGKVCKQIHIHGSFNFGDPAKDTMVLRDCL